MVNASSLKVYLERSINRSINVR